MSSTRRLRESGIVVAALVAGLALGAAFAALDRPLLARIVYVLEPAGVLWLNALRMTVVPLVVALLITAAAGTAATAATAAAGRTTLLTVGYFVLFLTLSALLAAGAMPLVLEHFPVQPDGAAALRAGLADAARDIPPPPPLRDWVAQLLPVNPIAAAAESATLPLMLFALLFGFAASRVDVTRRAPLLGFFDAVVEIMLVLVGWVLRAAPLGVFALALAVGFGSGVRAAGALGYYLVLMSALCVVITVLLYPAAAIWGRVGIARFAQAAAPAQAVAVSTQSSLASLPAMLTAAERDLGLSQRVAGLVLPLAVSMFRVTSPAVNLGIVLFVAHVYGVQIGAVALTAGVVVAVVTSFAVVSLPSQITFFTTTVPISLAMGVPTELLALLIAVEVIPDIFRTVGNVTGDLTVTAIVERRAA